MKLSIRWFSFALALPVVLASLASVAQSQTYTFTTIAGSPGLNGTNDGAGLEARFNFPSEITVDQSGVVYVCDFQNHTIRRVELSNGQWQVTTLAGWPRVFGFTDGTNTEARFDRPCGIEVDEHGNLFVADLYNCLIRQVTRVGAEWAVRTLAGLAGQRGSLNGTNSEARFWNPRGMGIDGDGCLYVADSATHIIRKIKPVSTNWVVTTPAGEWPYFGFVDDTNQWAEFNTPFSVKVALDGSLFVTDWGNHAIRQITRFGPDWVTTTVAGDGVEGADDGEGSKARFKYPTGIDVDSLGHLYVSDQDNHTIRKVVPADRGWQVTTIAGAPLESGSIDGVGSEARFNKPWGIAVDGAGNIFVADNRNHTIRMGVLQGAPAPALQIRVAPGEIVLSWPSTAADYGLEKTYSLAPGATWTPISEGIVVSGDSFVLTNVPTGPAAFYRLRR